MPKVRLDVLKPWIANRIHEMLGMEDDVVAEFVVNQLEAEKVIKIIIIIQILCLIK
jgi:serine/arginine repetitive matrix protein 1